MAAARQALEAHDAGLVLPYVPASGEAEVRREFDAVVGVRDEGEAVRELADRHFFETVVRVHRAGEGAPYTGLKPAGLDPGRVIPIAARAIATGSPVELVEVLTTRVATEVRDRLARVMELKARADGDLEANRAYVSAMLDLQVWAHHLYHAAASAAHAHED